MEVVYQCLVAVYYVGRKSVACHNFCGTRGQALARVGAVATHAFRKRSRHGFPHHLGEVLQGGLFLGGSYGPRLQRLWGPQVA